MTIKSFDKKNLGEVRADIKTALEAVEKKHGIKLSLGNISYNDNSFRATMNAGVADANTAEVGGNIKWQNNFKQNAVFYGLSTTDLGKEFEYGGKKYKIVGAMSLKANNQQIIVQKDGSDKFQRMDAEVVKLKLGK